MATPTDNLTHRLFSRPSVTESRDIIREDDGKIRGVYVTITREQGQLHGEFGPVYHRVMVYSHPTRCPATTAGPFPSTEAAQNWINENVTVRADLRVR